MANATLRLAVDAKDVADNLDAIADGLDRPISNVLGAGARKIAVGAHELMRERPEGAWKGSSGAEIPGHIRDYYEARMSGRLAAVVQSAHPAAPVWEWGGEIHPLLGASMHHFLSRSTVAGGMRLQLKAQDKLRPPWTFQIPAEHPVGRSADQQEEQITRDLDDAISRLVTEHGF